MVIASYIFSPSKKGTIHENLARLIFPPTVTKTTDEEGKTVITETPSTSTSLSLKDLANARKTDTEPLKEKIEETPASFIKAIFAIRLRRTQFDGWEDATYLVRDAINENGTTIANRSKTIDLITNFHAVSLTTIRDLAEKLWIKDASDTNDVRAKALDGKSEYYSRKVFAEFLFKSMDSSLAMMIHREIGDSIILNDGPLVWMTLGSKIFPSLLVFQTALSEQAKKLTLSSCDHLGDYCMKMREMLLILDDKAYHQAIALSFFREMEQHPSHMVRTDFALKGAQYFQGLLKTPIIDLLADAEKFYRLISSDAVPYSASPSPASSKSEELMSLLASSVTSQADTLAKMHVLLASHENRFKQQSNNNTKARRNGDTDKKPVARGPWRQTPSWYHTAPASDDEVKTFNDKEWRWCQKCNQGNGQWSTRHDTNSHVDNYVHPKKRNGGGDNNHNQANKRAKSQSSSNSKSKSSGSNGGGSAIAALKASLSTSNDNINSLRDLVASLASTHSISGGKQSSGK